MSVLHAIVLGITQGLAEFLPISSSGHLVLVPWLLRWNDFEQHGELEKAFDVALHLGTFVGSAAYFRHDIVRYAGAALRSVQKRSIGSLDERVAWLLAAASVPAAVVGVVFDTKLGANGGEWLVGVMLIVFGVVLWAVDRAAGGTREADEFRWRDAMLMGVGQAVSLQPGVSRSGATITAGRLAGFDRTAAVRLSFLMSLPITAGAAAYKLLGQVAGDGIPGSFYGAFFWGIVTSALVGFAAITVLLRFVRTRSFAPFVVYRVLAGVVVLAVAAAR